jgi:hypothetical protein
MTGGTRNFGRLKKTINWPKRIRTRPPARDATPTHNHGLELLVLAEIKKGAQNASTASRELAIPLGSIARSNASPTVRG